MQVCCCWKASGGNFELKILMSVQWVYMCYTIIEYRGITVIVDDTVTDKMKKGF